MVVEMAGEETEVVRMVRSESPDLFYLMSMDNEYALIILLGVASVVPNVHILTTAPRRPTVRQA